ncbi:MAG: CCA tRNA nucleotidyltransferase [Peptococcaceae bacterium]|nr:CCA tRNA nucleotidyltransferase [Peptococcaceae bacterium]
MQGFHQEVIGLLAGYAPVWLVGGAVRDYLLGTESKDMDLVSTLEIEKADEILREHGYRPHKIGAKFTTISLFQGEGRIDITCVTDLEQDARRRDFTINAMYMNPDNGQIFDPLDGRRDLKEKILRTCNQPEITFKQDPVRILRMVKLAVKLGFNIEDKVWSQAREQINLLVQTAKERVTAELAEILVLSEAEKAVNMLWDLSYWHVFIPELARLKGVVQNQYHSLDVWDHTMAVFRNTPQDLFLRLAGLFHDLGKWETASREYYLAGKLEYRDDNYWLEGCQIIGTRGKNELDYKLHPLLGKQVKMLGARLDHFPQVVQFKRLLSHEEVPQGLTQVENGKRHFLNHERASAKLAAEILKRYSFAMFFPGKGEKREKDLVELIANHMQATLIFMPELRGEPTRKPFRDRAAALVWQTCWNGREFELQKIHDFILLWRADFQAGKVHTEEQNEVLDKITGELIQIALWQNENLPKINWKNFRQFSVSQGIKGEELGIFKSRVRARAMQEMQIELNSHF